MADVAFWGSWQFKHIEEDINRMSEESSKIFIMVIVGVTWWVGWYSIIYVHKAM